MAININHQINQVNGLNISVSAGAGSTVGTAGIVTYYGDGSNLTGISAGGGCLKLVETTNLASDGTCSGCNITDDGENNIAIGFCAGKDLTTGDANVFLGTYAGENNNTGSCNVNIGWKSGFSAATSQNVFIGQCTGYNNTGNNNVAIGKQASMYRTSGSDNTFIGRYAGNNTSGQTGSGNIGIGYITLGGTGSHSNNIALGESAGQDMTNGNHNILLGQRAGYNQTTGSYNVFIGRCAAEKCAVTGSCNIAIGVMAGLKLTSGLCNVFIGECAGKCIDSQSRNTFIGSRAGHYAEGSDNFFGGWGAGRYVHGDYNVFIGRYSAKSTLNNNTHRNTGLGYASFCNIDDGCCNVAVGQNAGNKTTSGHSNVFLGSCAGYHVTTADYNILIGAGVTSHTTITGDCQFALGVESNRWLTGDSNFVTKSGNALEAGTFFQNATSLDTNTTFPASGTKNGGVFGPFTISNGVTLTISSGSTFTII